MARRSVSAASRLAAVWPRLHELETWDGIGGLRDLRRPERDADGHLVGFDFSIETPIGSIDDHATVRARRDDDRATVLVEADVKSVAVRLELDLRDHADGCVGDLVLDATARSFLAKPLAIAVDQALESGVDREVDRLVRRLEATR